MNDDKIQRILNMMTSDPVGLDKECIMLSDGSKINCCSEALSSDKCPHGIYLCGNKCSEGCKWVLNGEIKEYY